MTAAADATKLALVVLGAAVLQVTIFAGVEPFGGSPDLLLVTLVAVALLRGPVVGSLAGFLGGLVADVAALGTLGLSSLILTVAGYWIGRYGETTGRDKSHAPLLSVLVITILTAVGAFCLHFVLGDAVDARRALFTALVPAAIWNVALAVPIHAAVRRLVPRPEARDRVREVRLLG